MPAAEHRPACARLRKLRNRSGCWCRHACASSPRSVAATGTPARTASGRAGCASDDVRCLRRVYVRACTDFTGLLRSSPMTILLGLRRRPDQVPQVAVDILEALVVHEAVVLRWMRYAATSGGGLGDQAVHFFPAFATQANDHFIGFPGIRERLVDQGLEEGFACQHGLDGVVDDVHEGRVLAAKPGIEGKAESGKEGPGFVQVLYWQVEDDLFFHGVSLVKVEWAIGATSLRRVAAPTIDTLA